jgi:hypothetical protein
LELIVALMVFSVAVAGLFPLLVILSRDLQPLEKHAADGSVTYDCKTPARDGTTTGINLAYARHTWYLTPFDQPWARKLGAGVRIAPDNGAFASSSPVSTELPILSHDDDEDQSDADGDGLEDYTAGNGWTLGTGSLIPDRDDYHSHPALLESEPANFVSWNFTVTAAGWYVIEATWPSGVSGLTPADVATFEIEVDAPDKAPRVVSAAVSQAAAPHDEQDAAGTWWCKLADPLYIAASAVVHVRLYAPPEGETGDVVADGVRLVGVENNVRIDGPVVRSPCSVNGNGNNEDVTAHVSVTVNLPQAP